MARLPALIDALARIDGRPRGAIDHVAREVREAGLIQTTKRGRGAAEMTARDAAFLVLGVYGSDQPADAARAAAELSRAPIVNLFDDPLMERPDLSPLKNSATLVDAVAAVIELAPNLAASTALVTSDRKGGWVPRGRVVPGRYVAMLKLERSIYWSSVVIALPRARGTALVSERTALMSEADIDYDVVAPFEVTTYVHTDVFIALHAALFPPDRPV